MSFDTLLWLGLTLLFVIAPLFGNRGKQQDPKQQPRQPGQRPGAPPATGQPRTRSAPPAATQEQQGGWEGRLEEARRRIEAALAEESAQLPPQQTQRQAPAAAPARQPARGTLTSRTVSGTPMSQAKGRQPTAARPARPTPQARTRPPARRTPPPSRTASAASTQASIDRARRLKASENESAPQVTRKERRPTYTGRRRRLDDRGLFDAKSVVNGIIWHQILSEPPHKRGNRRRT